ncbi:MAG: lipoprotein [Proteobacteria bacterium]|nr:lipoprotein [Pseudomonadota bacterium]
MKKLLVLIVFVVVLAGCASKGATPSKAGTAEVITRDGQKWVHVLNSGVEFPLLGAWKGAQIETMRDKSGMNLTAIAVIYGEVSEHSRAVVAFVYPPKTTTESFANMVYSGDYSEQEAGKALCDKAELPFKSSKLVSPNVFNAQCQGTGFEYSGYLLEASKDKQITILYWGAGYAHEGAYPALQEMMRQVQIH